MVSVQPSTAGGATLQALHTGLTGESSLVAMAASGSHAMRSGVVAMALLVRCVFVAGAAPQTALTPGGAFDDVIHRLMLLLLLLWWC